jgi:tetratricopeptide (TPR) repeat protein
MFKRLKRALFGRRHHHHVSDGSFVTHGVQRLWHRQWLKRRVNYLLLLALAVGLGLFGVGVHFLHAYQVKRNAGLLLEHARKARAAEKSELAEMYLRNYLELVPGDAAVQYEYGLVLEESARQAKTHRYALMEKAYFALDRAVRLDDRPEVRRRAIQVAMDIHLFSQAQQHLDALRAKTPDDPELMLLAARCALELKKHDDVEKLLNRVLELAPAQVEPYVLLARLYHNQKRPQDADDVMADLIDKNKANPQAHLARVPYNLLTASRSNDPKDQEQRRKQADEDLVTARRLAPDDADVLILSAEVALSRGKLDEAREYLERGLAKHPKNVKLYQLLYLVEARADRPAQAIAYLEKGLKELPAEEELRRLLAEALVVVGRTAEADKLIEQLRKRSENALWVQYLEACERTRKREWLDAARQLEHLRPILPERAYAIDLLLVRCYQAIGDADRRVEAARRLVEDNKTDPAAQLELNAALLAAGRSPEEAGPVLRGAGNSPQAKVQTAQLLGVRQLNLLPAQRDWKPIEDLLREAEKEDKDSPRPSIILAEVLLAQDRDADARKVLEEARARFPAPIEVALALAKVVNRLEGPDKALEVLQGAGDAPEVRLARAAYRIPRQPDEARRQLAALEKDLANLPADEQAALLGGLAGAYTLLNEPAQAERFWKRLAELQPYNLRVRLLLFDRAYRANNEDELKRLLNEVRRIDGTSGPYAHQAEAALLLVQARKGNKEALPLAKRQLDEADRLRPKWSSVALLRAEIKEMEKDPAAALDFYRQAIELGERRPEVVLRAVQLLFARRQYEEANNLFKRMEKQTLLTGELGRMAAEVSLRNQDRERTLELVRQSVKQNAKDYRQLLWLGQMLVVLEEKGEAESALRRAVDLAPGSPETHIALIQLLADTDQKAKVEDALKKANESKLPPLALAACCEMARQPDEAAKHYAAALQEKPGDLEVLRSVILFHQRRGEYGQAEALARNLLKKDELPAGEQAWARRQLAFALAMSGDQSKYNEALALLDKADQRLRALLLSTRPAQRREAIEMLEDLLKQGKLIPEERFRLALLYEAAGDWANAEKHLSNLIKDVPNARYLAHYLHGLLKRGAVEQAAEWLPALEKLDPAGFPTLSVQMRLRLAQKKEADALELAQVYVKDKPAASLALVGALLEELKQDVAAEAMVRRYAAKADSPDAQLALVQFLARHGKLPEALDKYAPLWDKLPPERMAAAGAALARQGKADAAQCRALEGQLQKAQKANPTSLALAVSLADLYEYQEKYGEAMKLYGEILQRNSRHVVALNNLAWLLTLKEHRPDPALQLAELAIKEYGPIPELLDTRAVIQMQRGQNDLAVKDLEVALAQDPTPTRLFHLAAAHLSGKNEAAAREALQKAMALGLKAETLHPLEREQYKRLMEQLK